MTMPPLSPEDIEGLFIPIKVCQLYQREECVPDIETTRTAIRDRLRSAKYIGIVKNSEDKKSRRYKDDKFEYIITKNDGRYPDTKFDYILYYLSTQKIHPGELIFNEVLFWTPTYQNAIKWLAEIAVEEDWDLKNSSDHTVLKSYFQYTYYKASKDKCFSYTENDKLKALNTGLFTRNFHEPIYAIFSKRNMEAKKPTWMFVGFCSGGDNIGTSDKGNVSLPTYKGINIKRFPLKPKAINYLNGCEFEVNRLSELQEDIAMSHILEDNNDRLPLWFKKLSFAEQSSQLREAIYTACKRVQCDFRTAVPAYYPTTNEISWLLPLLFEPNHLCALVVSNTYGKYHAKTILTTDQAYTNARLIRRPLKDWLLPKQIECQTIDSSKPKNNMETEQAEPITNLETIKTTILSLLNKNSDEDGWMHLPKLIQKVREMYPDFEYKNYGYTKFKEMIESFPEIQIREDDSRTIILVRKKDLHKQRTQQDASTNLP